MYKQLYDHLQRLALYERTIEKFWDDPYIATQMLEAHLDPNIDAASRRPEFIGRCADWIASILPKGASLLDIGCGPGLYAKRFTERGLKVTGLDLSENSIAYARKHDQSSTYILGDYLAMNFENEFDMITLIYYDYGALIPEERHILLPRVYRALKPGGQFVLDVMTPLTGKGKKNSTSWSVHPDGGFWSPKPHICMNGSYCFAEIAEGRKHIIIEGGEVKHYNLWECYFTRQTLLEEVAPYGFTEVGFYCDVTGTPYAEESETLCTVLKKEKLID